MKKLLTILAAASFLVSTSTTTVVSCTVKSKSINSLNFNWDLGVLEEVSQKEIIRAIARVNDIDLNDKRGIELLASMKFDYNSTVSFFEEGTTSNPGDKLTFISKIEATPNSKVLKGSVNITFKATDEAVIKSQNPIQNQEKNLVGTWWNWGNTIKDEHNNDKGLGWRGVFLEQFAYNEKNPYDIINISSLYTKAGEYQIDSLNINDLTYNPHPKPENPGWPYDGDNDDTNSHFLIDRKKRRETNGSSKEGFGKDPKIITSLGGATADRMMWKWNQKNQLKNKLKEVLDTFGLDGLEIALSGRTLYNRESQETLSQAVKEIMVENWLQGKDFYLSISTRIPWLLKSATAMNKPSVVPFIESMDGWFNDISIITYNLSRPVNQIIAPETFTVDGVTYEKGEKIRSNLSPDIEKAAFFYGTIRALLDDKWNPNSKYYDLSNKPIRIATTTPFASSTGGFGFEKNSDESNLEIALREIYKDTKVSNPDVARNIVGLSYFGITLDQIISNEKPTEPTKFNHGSSLSKFIEEANKLNKPKK
ncbi:hypothetical protein [Spiroplasma sp. BIUS-1]|uniref:hypothetical protein n=1 Tax=Spiroplasma sp. BIUS-1 TaxID=216964 RepID=UPI0013978B67|nr:hypothetical protein [Spiroplasma sp. BIUS-1]QHX36848.1 hypothetical protein SBIUS_v1c05950 [Spiroplasma sp. BIUS-1]